MKKPSAELRKMLHFPVKIGKKLTDEVLLDVLDQLMPGEDVEIVFQLNKSVYASTSAVNFYLKTDSLVLKLKKHYHYTTNGSGSPTKMFMVFPRITFPVVNGTLDLSIARKVLHAFERYFYENTPFPMDVFTLAKEENPSKWAMVRNPD